MRETETVSDIVAVRYTNDTTTSYKSAICKYGQASLGTYVFLCKCFGYMLLVQELLFSKYAMSSVQL